jgi:hypothetical protein
VVPWIKTSAEDEREYQPEDWKDDEEPAGDVKEKLKSLGYV